MKKIKALSQTGGGGCPQTHSLPSQLWWLTHLGKRPTESSQGLISFTQLSSSTPINILSLYLYLGVLAEALGNKSFFLIKRSGSSLTLRTPPLSWKGPQDKLNLASKNPFPPRLINLLITLHVRMTCLPVCIGVPHACSVPLEVRRGHWIPWDWSYRLSAL